MNIVCFGSNYRTWPKSHAQCKLNGFSGQTIGFQKTGKKKAEGKPFWLLVNGDMSAHSYVQPQAQVKTRLERSPNIEQEDKPPARPPMA